MERMEQRGVTLEEVIQVMRSTVAFSYRHEGIDKVGYYDANRTLFVGTIDGLVTTVIKGIGQDYVDRLMKVKP
jgi:hypothetical protein